jgi:hypothetical protein
MMGRGGGEVSKESLPINILSILRAGVANSERAQGPVYLLLSTSTPPSTAYTHLQF